MTASNHAFSAFSFISFVLTFIPFAWHLEAWNTGTCIYMGWIGLGSLFLFINSVVWDGNAINWAPVYCDIVTKFFIGLSVSVPAAALCINRRLYHIVRVTTVTRTISEKRRAVFVDLAIGIGIPILIMILHVVVQGHRFDIYEDIGCMPTIYNTPLAYALVLAPPLGLAVIACIYSALAVFSLRRNYVQFKQLLSSNGTNPGVAGRYIRLMCLAGLEALLDVPLNLYIIISSARRGVDPWISWDDTHFDFGRVEQVPAVLWRSSPEVVSSLERTRWTVVACGLVFFGFFGFADEAMKNYKIAYNFIALKFGWKPIGVPGIPSPGYSARGLVGESGGRGTGSNTGGSNEKNGKRLGVNGTESWMTTFDAFANRVKLVFLQSWSSASFSGQSTNGTHTGNPVVAANQGLPVYISTEMVQRRDMECASVFTSLTDFSTGGSEGSMYTVQKGSQCAVDGEKKAEMDCSDCDSDVEPSTMPSSPPPPPVPPKDSRLKPPTIALSPTLPLTPSRTPPKQRVPSSVSVSPSPNGSFLDLSASELEIPPVRGNLSADNRV